MRQGTDGLSRFLLTPPGSTSGTGPKHSCGSRGSRSTARGIDMRISSLAMPLVAAAVATGASLAVASPAQADDDPIVKLVSAQNSMCLQPVNGSLLQGAAIVQEPCNG